MSNYDYEITRYSVRWAINEESKEQLFETEESAIKFAREIIDSCDWICVIQERAIKGWLEQYN